MADQAALSPAELGVLAERLGPLPLINHFLWRMGLLELLEQHVPTTDRRSTVSHAQALGVLLRSIIVEREPIYRQQESTSGFAAGLFGVSAAQAERLSDDRIGRALDRLFDADRAALLTDVVLTVAKRFGVGPATAAQRFDLGLAVRSVPTSRRAPRARAHRASGGVRIQQGP